MESRIDGLRSRLDALVGVKSRCESLSAHRGVIDVVITNAEINDLHGTGPLLKRVLRGRSNLLSIRFSDDWGRHDLGEWDVRLPQSGLDRAGAYRNVTGLLEGCRVRSVLSVPLRIDDVMAAIALHDVFRPKLAAYIMDDQNIAGGGIPDSLMRELLERCSLRLATHPELRSAYQRKYGLPFFLLPAVAPDALIPRETLAPTCAPTHEHDTPRGALAGSFWDQSWFDRLCEALENSGYAIDWFGNHRSPWMEFSAPQLERARIQTLGVVPEERLAAELRGYPFVIVPTGSLEAGESNRSVASLSLPGRIIFAAAASQTPILVVGSRRTCAARFVEHFAIGETVPYQGVALKAAMRRLSGRRVQEEMRARAARIGPVFSDRGVAEWLAQSVELGRAADMRFENVFAGYCSEP